MLAGTETNARISRGIAGYAELGIELPATVWLMDSEITPLLGSPRCNDYTSSIVDFAAFFPFKTGAQHKRGIAA